MTPAVRLLQSQTGAINSTRNASPVKKERPPMTVNDVLPDPFAAPRRNRRTFIAFCVVMGVSLLAIFNYEKVSSPIMNATMYFLRRSKVAREKLGKSITFEGNVPWIKGELNTMKGNVDIQVRVAGDSAGALMKLKASRSNRGESFQIAEWQLLLDDGSVLDLLKDESVNLEF
ncbi:hypothetical protein OGAPHI_005980 [Ogataea philodendri]|uniref:Uncharacterized protein n=1 Tax=Ogataea philodendri TaxID=1378263 RepID=A0A9P8NYA9_9ASCO|nr:uncharacterized protein OGAPHI_005980 [Ogataea philodendri]KAH3661802.1 hypothetical protein OGAPHI_005980 [Ogataea philodendri]